MSLLSFQQKHKIQEMHTVGISLCIPPSVSVGMSVSVQILLLETETCLCGGMKNALVTIRNFIYNLH